LIGVSLRNADTTNPDDPFSYVPAFLAQMRITAARAGGAEIWVGGAGFSLFGDDLLEALPPGTKGATGAAVSGIPAPRWDLVDMDRLPSFPKNLSIGIEVSRGCVFVAATASTLISRDMSYRQTRCEIASKRRCSGLWV
jgi:hypothetical protein